MSDKNQNIDPEVIEWIKEELSKGEKKSVIKESLKILDIDPSIVDTIDVPKTKKKEESPKIEDIDKKEKEINHEITNLSEDLEQNVKKEFEKEQLGIKQDLMKGKPEEQIKEQKTDKNSNRMIDEQIISEKDLKKTEHKESEAKHESPKEKTSKSEGIHKNNDAEKTSLQSSETEEEKEQKHSFLENIFSKHKDKEDHEQNKPEHSDEHKDSEKNKVPENPMKTPEHKSDLSKEEFGSKESEKKSDSEKHKEVWLKEKEIHKKDSHIHQEEKPAEIKPKHSFLDIFRRPKKENKITEEIKKEINKDKPEILRDLDKEKQYRKESMPIRSKSNVPLPTPPKTQVKSQNSAKSMEFKTHHSDFKKFINDHYAAFIGVILLIVIVLLSIGIDVYIKYAS